MPKLTHKQQLYVEHYNKTGNGTESARVAGYKGTDVTLAAVGYENLNKPHIASALKALQATRAMHSNRTQHDMDAFLWSVISNDSDAMRDRLTAAQQVQRLNGWVVDRSESKHVSGSPDEWVAAQARAELYKRMPLEQLRAEVQKERLAIAAPQEPRTEE